jgi:hypothetical protein
MLVRTSMAVIVAPGTAAPLSSFTLPSSVPFAACGLASDGMLITSTNAAIAMTNARTGRTLDIPNASEKLRRIDPSIETL